MVTLETFVFPESLEEATAMLSEGRQKARIVAGGTSMIFFRGRGTQTLVDITRLGLDEIRAEGENLAVGACARLQRIADSPLMAEPGLRALADAAGAAGPRAVRNAVTLGGNVAGFKRWSDLPVPLIALGARCEIAGPDPRSLLVADLLARHPLKQLAPGEIIRRFLVGRPSPRSGSAFVKFGRTAIDYALASAAARVVLDEGGRITDAALVIGSVRTLPTPLPEIASSLRGQATTADVLDAAAAQVPGALDPTPDLRASPEYLLDLSRVVARDALGRAVRRARDEEVNDG